MNKDYDLVRRAAALVRRTIPKLSIAGLEYKIKVYREWNLSSMNKDWRAQWNITPIDIFERASLIADLRIELNRRKTQNKKVLKSPGY